MEKTNKELYTELAEKLKEIQDKANEAAKFATENKLTFQIFGATFVPDTNEVRDEYDEGFIPVDEISPSEEGGFYPEDRGTFWVSSNCW